MSDPVSGSLAGISLFDELDAAELRELEKASSLRRYAGHEQIIDRQSDSTDVFFVIEGKVRVVNYSLSGREITLDDITAGRHFGELAAIDGQPRSASVMALEETLLASLPQERFLDVARRRPEVSYKVMLTLARIIRISTDRIMDLSTLAANNRVQAELLREARSTPTSENSAEIRPIPVHGDIASRVSTTRETVARVLNDLARQGIVEREKEALVIHDLNRLSEMVEEVRGE